MDALGSMQEQDAARPSPLEVPEVEAPKVDAPGRRFHLVLGLTVMALLVVWSSDDSRLLLAVAVAFAVLFTLDTGFAYLPDGPTSGGYFVEAQLEHRGGDWYEYQRGW